MRQILYVSDDCAPGDQRILEAILQQSRHNNALDGVTGILWNDGKRFAQVLEGDERAIDDVLHRILADTRHRSIEIVHDRPIAERQFGSWLMDWRTPDNPPDEFDERLRHMLAGTPATVRDAFALAAR